MNYYYYSIELETKKQTEFIDLTKQIREKINESEIKNGFVLVYTKHTTTAVLVNEREPNLQENMEEFLEKISPSSKRYSHDEVAMDERPNTHSHLKTLLLSSSAMVPIKEGKLLMGTWQSIFFVELDGTRKRTVLVQVAGD